MLHRSNLYLFIVTSCVILICHAISYPISGLLFPRKIGTSVNTALQRSGALHRYASMQAAMHFALVNTVLCVVNIVLTLMIYINVVDNLNIVDVVYQTSPLMLWQLVTNCVIIGLAYLIHNISDDVRFTTYTCYLLNGVFLICTILITLASHFFFLPR